MDLIYNPLRTRFLLRARELGIPCSDGLPMLVAQAAAADGLFLGNTVPMEKIESVLHEMYCRMTNIVLVGMPGCGKSRVGKELRRLSGRELFDTDEMVVQSEGRSIPDIFAQNGEAYFRKLENRALRDAANGCGRIITTGGGAVKDMRNLEPLRQNGRIFHLERPLGLLSREGRPLSLAGDPEALYAERLPLYERFRDAVIENTGTPAETAQLILEELYAHSDNQRTESESAGPA